MNDTSDFKTIVTSTLLHVWEQNVLLRSGKKKVHIVAERLPTVSVFPLTENNEIYLVDEFRPLYGKRVLASVAGFMDKGGESPLQAAKRELQEEAGITAHHWETIADIDLAGSVFKGNTYLFLAKDLEVTDTQSLDEDEDILRVKISLDEAVKKVFSGKITISTSVIGILMLDKLRQERKLF